jgi:hypothetical protein
MVEEPPKGNSRCLFAAFPSPRWAKEDSYKFVIPAKAGTHHWRGLQPIRTIRHAEEWVPAFAGMTVGGAYSIVKEWEVSWSRESSPMAAVMPLPGSSLSPLNEGRRGPARREVPVLGEKNQR